MPGFVSVFGWRENRSKGSYPRRAARCATLAGRAPCSGFQRSLTPPEHPYHAARMTASEENLSGYMDMVSISLPNPSKFPDEQVHIESVGHYWTLLTELLKATPAK